MILTSVFLVIVPIGMILIVRRFILIEKLFSFIANLSFLMVASIISFAIYQIIVEQTVFMTSIHGIFLNPFLLVCGAYLLLFTMYKLLTDLISH